MIEVTVTVALMGIVAAALVSFLAASQSNLERQAARTMNNDEIRLAVESLDREVRSGNVVYNPTGESYAPGDVVAGMSLRVYSQTNGEPRCVQWRITSDGDFQRRTWTPYWYLGKPGASVSGWRTVATDVVNRQDSVSAFTRPQTNIVDVRVRVSSDASGVKGSTVEVQQSVAGRNTSHFPAGAASEVCGPSTPDPALSGAGHVPPYDYTI